MAKIINQRVVVPSACLDAVEEVIKKYRAGLKPRSIKRKLRITKKQFANGQKIVRQHSDLGVYRERWLDKLGNEYVRLEDLLMSAPRSPTDKKWLEKQLDLLDKAIDYAENA